MSGNALTNKTYSVILMMLSMNALAGESTVAKCSVPLNGQASGGYLVFADISGRDPLYSVILTFPGESASIVANRLADSYNNDVTASTPYPFGKIASVNGCLNGLAGDPSQYILAGTEAGLGIPVAPYSLTANHDADNKRLTFHWKNAPGGYDRIGVCMRWKGGWFQDSGILPESVEEWTKNLDGRGMCTNEHVFAGFDFAVFGIKNGTPSSAATIYVRGNIQEELHGLPFSRGIAPNWTGFMGDGFSNDSYSMGIRHELTFLRLTRNQYNHFSSKDSRPFYQIINVKKSAISGVMREFISLNKGHTYRLSIRINTLEAAEKNEKWSCTVHVLAVSSDEHYSPRQLTGLDALPNSTTGSESKVMEYLPGNTTSAKYSEIVKDIVLREQQDRIIVWMKLKGEDESVAVAVDYISLEDCGETR